MHGLARWQEVRRQRDVLLRLLEEAVVEIESLNPGCDHPKLAEMREQVAEIKRLRATVSD